MCKYSVSPKYTVSILRAGLGSNHLKCSTTKINQVLGVYSFPENLYYEPGTSTGTEHTLVTK